MLKRIINQSSKELSRANQGWLDLERLAQVEITSEDEGNHIESALTTAVGPGWTVSQPGEQTIRLLFDEPQGFRRIHLVFDEDTGGRIHEFELRWSSDGGGSLIGRFYASNTPSTRRTQPGRSKTTQSISTG